MKENTCCFCGHREVENEEAVATMLRDLIERLITEEHIDTFLFGSVSRFNTICYFAVTEAKKKHPHIRRVYVRAEYPYISEEYLAFLLERYERTCFPPQMIGAGRAVYAERNRHMIDESRICVMYYDPAYIPEGRGSHASKRRSGTAAAWAYAMKRGIRVVNLHAEGGK